MSAFFQTPRTLSKQDFLLFHQLFVIEIEQLLPVKGSISFWTKEGFLFAGNQIKERIEKDKSRFSTQCNALAPAIINNVIVLPLRLSEDGFVAILISDIDPGLLQKMAPEWLCEFREDIHHALLQVKDLYIYPETGLYCSRLLELIWHNPSHRKGAFFLLGCPERSKHATGNLVKLISKAHLVETVMNGPVCYFGGNVFGVYQEGVSRETSLRLGRQIIGRLKRNGAPYVQIGIAQLSQKENESKEHTLDECWQALEIAEKRGPYSLCEASFVHNVQIHPFAMPDPATVRKLHKGWRGMELFALMLVRLEEGKFKLEEFDGLVNQVKQVLPEATFAEPQGWQEKYFLLPGVSEKKAKKIAEKVKKNFEKKYGSRLISVGVAFWPYQDFSKKAVFVNCRKALVHGDFFGPGTVTVFDQISLNVSGDYYFDEGDYRKAVRDYKAGLKIEAQEVNLMNSLGVALTELNRLKEAIRCFDSVLQKEPKNFMALVNMGFAMRSLKQDDEALACLQKAKKCREFSGSSVFTDITIVLGRMYCEKGLHGQAIPLLEKLLSRKPESTGFLMHSLLGEAYAATGNSKKAILHLQKTLQLNPHDAKSLSILGHLYEVEGEGSDVALSLCKQALALDDQSWDNWYRMARVKYLAKDYAGAAAAIKESLHRNRKAVDAIFLSGKIQEMTGKIKLAQKKYERVIQLAPGYPGAKKALQSLS